MEEFIWRVRNVLGSMLRMSECVECEGVQVWENDMEGGEGKGGVLGLQGNVE